ncbi:MAG: SpvB/TcaC N-terminal domain-containing protein [Bradymonadia bacterium]
MRVLSVPCTRVLSLAWTLSLLPAMTSAQTGASDDRVSLPEGPGSFEGVGDNAVAVGNTGAMTYNIDVEVSPGHPGATPDLALSYNTSGGNGIMGMGWHFGMPAVERMSNRGLPEYTEDDTMVFGSTELVRISDGEPAEYRARYEGSFARYFWHDRAQGSGHWQVHQPDGTVQWFGAEADGRVVSNAVLEGADGVFRWHLVEQRDKFEHPMRLFYVTLDGRPYLDEIEYIYDDNGDEHGRVQFGYEVRPDPVSDARSGFNEIMSRRLSTIETYFDGTRVRRYVLDYEDAELSGGLSRLASVQMLGLDEQPFSSSTGFTYSGGIGTGEPALVDMGFVGGSPVTGNATLVDLNGDGLPDMLDTTQPGAHRIYLNTLGGDGSHQFSAARESELGIQAGHQLSSPYTQILDINGDGKTDLLNAQTGEALLNDGSGDWGERVALSAVGLPDFGEDFAGGGEELTYIRFFDYDNDRRIDVIRATDVTTQIYANTAESFDVVPDVEAIGRGFDTSRLELADLTGDGLLDAVVVAAGSLEYRINLGRGRWSAWRTIESVPYSANEVDEVRLEDINGDSLDDLVIVRSGQLRYALNRGDDTFDGWATIEQAGGQALPDVVDNTTVLFADMNASGSDDVVYIGVNGSVRYLELFPLRPNLLTAVEDSHGVRQDISYTTAAEHRAADDEAWQLTAPFPMLMVTEVQTGDTLTDVVERTRYRYRDAFYDDVEKQYRGFAHMETWDDGDAWQVGMITIDTYNVGQSDRYLNGLMSRRARYSQEAPDDLIRSTEYTYDDCMLTGVPETTPAIRYVCPRTEITTIAEGGPGAEAVTTRITYEHDGYGNITLVANEGVTDVEGDERYQETDYIDPESLSVWLPHLPSAARVYGDLGGEYTEQRTYYDGDAFVGLPLGEATLGLATRSEARIEGDTYVDMARQRFDAHGNIVERLDVRAPGDEAGYRGRIVFDDLGLQVLAEERENLTPEGQAYTLRRDFAYHPVFRSVSESSDVYIVGVNEGEVGSARYTYDALGRVVAIHQPGDGEETPISTFEYQFDGALSRIVSRHRTTQNAAEPDQVHVECFDAAGRMFQRRMRIDATRWRVEQAVVFNSRGSISHEHLIYVSEEADCEITPPADALAYENHYDALGRPVRTVIPDGETQGTASFRRIVYGPLTETQYDGEDTDEGSPYFDTPSTYAKDGLGRMISVTYRLTEGDPLVTRYTYDPLGWIDSVTDPEGNTRVQSHNLLGQIVWVEDADRGRTTFEYDDAGNPVRTEDAAGRVVRQSYDLLNRRTALWDAADEAGTKATFQYDFTEGCPEGLCTFPSEQLVGVNYLVDNHEVQVWYGRDERRRVTRTRWLVDGVPFDATLAYDHKNRIVEERYPGDVVLEYQYDALDRISAIPGIVESAEYSDLGRLQRRTYANGVTEALDFNGVGQTLRRRLTDADGEGLLDMSFGFNRVGGLVEVTDMIESEGRPGRGVRYGYDAIYRLTSAALDPDRPDYAETLSYAYSASGRLVNKSSSRGAASALHVGELAYSSGTHRVTQAGDLALTYDDAGMMTRRGETRYSWNALGRLTEATRAGEALALYGYDPSGERVLRHEGAHFAWSLTPSFEIEDGMLLVHVTMNGMRVATVERDALAAKVLPDAVEDEIIDIADAVVHDAPVDTGAAEDQTRQMLSASVRRMLLDGEDRITWLHNDQTHNAAVITDARGAEVEQRAFSPFGGARHFDSGAETTYGFAGKETDRGTGLTYFGSRYYDSVLGRWSAADPTFVIIEEENTGTPLQMNDPYSFSQNNPVSFLDADGNRSSAAWEFMMAGIGAAINILTGGAGSVAGAIIGGAAGLYGSVMKQVILYKVGGLKPTPLNVLWSAGTVLFSTAAAALAGSFFGVSWAGMEWIKAGAQVGLAYKAAQTYANGEPTEATTKWEVAGDLVGMASPSWGLLTTLVRAIGVGGYAAATLAWRTYNHAKRWSARKAQEKWAAMRKKYQKSKAMPVSRSQARNSVTLSLSRQANAGSVTRPDVGAGVPGAGSPRRMSDAGLKQFSKWNRQSSVGRGDVAKRAAMMSELKTVVAQRQAGSQRRNTR